MFPLIGRTVSRRSDTHGLQIKKQDRNLPINGVWKTCNGVLTLMDQEPSWKVQFQQQISKQHLTVKHILGYKRDKLLT